MFAYFPQWILNSLQLSTIGISLESSYDEMIMKFFLLGRKMCGIRLTLIPIYDCLGTKFHVIGLKRSRNHVIMRNVWPILTVVCNLISVTLISMYSSNVRQYSMKF